MALPDDIYEAVLQPEMWPSVLRSIAHELGAKDLSIGSHDVQTGSYEVFSLPIDPVFAKSYADYWAPRNFLWRGTSRLPVGALFSFETVLPRDQFARTAFYNEWWRPQGMEHALGGNLLAEGSLSAVATVYRPSSAEAFDSDSKRRFSELLPHLQRAMQLRARLAQVDIARDDLRKTLAALGKPALLVDPHCRILFANPAAEMLIAREAEGWIDRTRLSAWLRGEASALGRLVFDMVERGAAGGRMALHRPSGRPLLLLAAPVHRSGSAYGVPTGLIIIDDGERPWTLSDPQPLLREAFGFTSMEAKVAIDLLNGLRVRDLPSRYDISYTTARTHVAHVLQKSQVTSQAELLALLIRTGF